MYFATITFYIAFVGILGMLTLKYVEIKRNRKSFLSRLADRTDYIFQAVYSKVRFVASHINKHNAIAVVQWVAFHVLSFFRAIYLYVRELAHRHPHSKKVIDMVTGKGEIRPNGAASFYLKQIAEETKK